MEQYYLKSQTPLKFHKFFWYVLLPLNFISTAITFYQEFSVMTEFTWLYAVDGVFFTLALFLMMACFIGFFGWKSYAWYSVMAFLGLLVVSGIGTVAVYAAYDPDQLPFAAGQLLAAILEAALIGKYYRKRRPLFFSGAQPAAAPFSVMDAHYLDDDAHLDDFSEEAADDDADFAEESDDDDDFEEESDGDDGSSEE